MSKAVLSAPEEPTRYPDAPSTWYNARGHIFMCFGWPSSAGGPPPASYHDLEEKSQFANQTFIGGLQVCVIVQYLESPIGEYDELLWIPGAFQNPWTGKQTYRATRAYVSMAASLYNGRKNWNVTRICTKFEFTPSEPFMELDFEPILFKSRPFLPINTKYIPIDFSFDFPPLPQSEEEGLVGTCEWKRVLLEISGKAGMVRVKGTTGDGINYPRLNNGGYWLWVKDAKIRIEGAQVRSKE
ncbi:uncharacterized protein BO87DRAFT_410177 [Aspergillus neoniger CBS 115656]|uniref:Acetoacetate decarboxylase n=1 Tax=Aspergillus neoniger (strain CBS 115656) TaxID=1448310 RepID=A0A318YP04_ASPNB|nr:hypothetical protein BO87DRAFT_410177 [Aspergillus neoniger CBS 115656]PYH29928.1 hypothetical protein BO87DRAFT_410177 [Aspergillus neoniger CBS 115656]